MLVPQDLRRKIKPLFLLATLVIASSLVTPFARAQTVVATVTVGSGPADLAYDSARGEVFVANDGSDTVSVISDSTNTVVATVPLPAGSSPFGAAYDPAKGEVFVTNIHANTVSVISDGTRSTTTSVSCSPSTIQDFHSTTCTATVTDTSPGTPMTPTGTVSWSSNGPGIFSSTTCTLSGTGGTATCSVSFTSVPGMPSVITITGNYGGDADHSGSSGSTTITHK